MGRPLAVTVATENRIRAGADAAMGYPRFGMRDLLRLLGGLLVGLFRSHAARGVGGMAPPSSVGELRDLLQLGAHAPCARQGYAAPSTGADSRAYCISHLIDNAFVEIADWQRARH